MGTVMSNLSTQHTDDFVKMILADSEMRKRFTDELLRRATHIPDLGDTDLVEFVFLPVTETDDGDGHEAMHTLSYCKVGQLPYWLNAALKAQFRDRASGTAQVSQVPGDGRLTHDGRIEFQLYENDMESHRALTDAYIDHLEYTIEAECIPNKEDAGYPDPADDVDICDAAPGVQPDTVLYDAWDMSVNDAEDRIREEFDEHLAGQYLMHMGRHGTSWHALTFKKALEAEGAAQVSTVWVRKPPVRIVLHPSCE